MNPNRLNLNLSFSLEGIPVQAVNMTCERFQRSIPSHSHGSGSYEIHYIPSGYGKLTSNGTFFTLCRIRFLSPAPMWSMPRHPCPKNPWRSTVFI